MWWPEHRLQPAVLNRPSREEYLVKRVAAEERMLLKHLQNSKASRTGVNAMELWQQFSMPDRRLPSQAEKANHPKKKGQKSPPN